MLLKRLKEDFHVTQKEISYLLGVTVVTALLLSFRMWGDDAFNINTGIENFIIFSLSSLIALSAHFIAERIYAIRKGLKSEYKANPMALGIGFLLAVLTNGLVFILAPGYQEYDIKIKRRIGKWRLRPYFTEYGYAALWGIFANLFLAGIFSPFLSIAIVEKFVRTNVMIAFFSLIPAPFYDGFHLFFASFYQIIFAVVFVTAFSLLLYTTNVWFALGVALLFGAISFMVTFHKLKIAS